MAIFVDENTKVIIQGLSPTSQGKYHGLRNKAYGTKVLAGTNPNVKTDEIEGIPLYATVQEAVDAQGVDARFISVPPRSAAPAILEAAEAGIRFIVCITEGIPAQDEARVYNTLAQRYPHSRLLGPNCPAGSSPWRGNVGITAGEIPLPLQEGQAAVGIVSRSGTLTYQALYDRM